MDLSTMEQVIIGTVLVPVVMTMFKNEISSFFHDLRVYRNRMFDADGDPGTGEDCYIFNSYTGQAKRITVKAYKFSVFPSKRVVETLHAAPNGEEGEVIVVPYTYAQWASILKGSLEKSIVELG